MKIVHQTPYAVARAAAYPPLTELADALVKQAAGDDTQLKAYVAKCEAVKAAHPKPGVTPPVTDKA
ncbi:hypothetical protein [Methylobacterium sp. 285MFTsu5.1]|uniref:hypothetical protein n=1 Tax=Methylobacterium sp. 285MFTsu5.1 TaxID=1172187 RepID=UPI00036665DE|nr:hypothetical protein [Methylobacterium sp. 285MFTsu5.1]